MASGKTQSTSFLGSTYRLGRISIETLRWSGDATYETCIWRAKDHHISLHVPLTARFEAKHDGVTVTVPVGTALIVSGSGEMRRRWTGSSYLLNIMIDREAVDQRLMRGATLSNVVPSLPGMTVINLQKHRTLSRFVALMLDDIVQMHPALTHESAATEAERLFLQLLLGASRDAQREQPLGERHIIVPAHLRAAERFIRLNYNKDLEISDIAQAGGVSVRTVQYSFQRYRGTTPMEFLRSLRLTTARQHLLQGDTSSILKIVSSIGYGSHSQFTRDYKRMFGEAPRTTRLTVRSDKVPAAKNSFLGDRSNGNLGSII